MIKKFKLFEAINNKIEDIFKIGDRVICKGHYNGVTYRDNIGTIISFYYEDNLTEFLVKFDEKFTAFLHNGDNNEDPTNHSSYVLSDMVRHVEEEKNIKIKWYNKGQLKENINMRYDH